jgi:predicted enzyme related to lactoylglutathione lyase
MANVNHVGVTVGNLDEAIAFYSAVFGLTVLAGAESCNRGTRGGERRVQVFGERWHEMRIAHLADEHGTGVELFEFIDPSMVKPAEHFDYWRIGISHIAFTTADLEAAIAALERHGGTARTAIHEVLPGCRVCYCMDPWGNPVELSSETYPATHPHVH